MTLECQNEIFLTVKQTVKKREDIAWLNCIKGASSKVTGDKKWTKEPWKDYIEKPMNEENECYLGDMLSVNGDAEARIRIG